MDQKGNQLERSGRPAISDKKIDALFWTGALILTLGVRFYLFGHYYGINNDGLSYIKTARHFWQGQWASGLASFFPPLFPLMTASIYPLTGDWELAGQFWTLALGVLVLFPLFGLLRRIYGSRVARVALFFYAVSPHVARLSLEVRTESPYIFFVVSALYLFQRGVDTGSRLPFFLGGITSALAYLLRPEGIGLVIVGASFLFFRGWMSDRLKQSLLQSALLVFGFALFSSPYILYLKWDTGTWSISRKTGALFLAGMAKHDADAAAEVGLKRRSGRISILDEISARPLAYAKKVFVDTLRALGFYFKALHFSYLPFLFIAWLVYFHDRFWEKPDFLLMAFVSFYLAALPLLVVTLRYSVPLAVVSLGWIGVGYLAVEEYVFRRWEKKGPLVIGLLLFIFFVGTLPKTLQSVGWERSYLREAGLYLKGKPGYSTVFTTSGHVAFYAEGKHRVFLPKSRVGDSLSLSAGEGDYLALDGESFGKLGATLDTFKDRGWLLEKTFSTEDKGRILVFRRLAVR